MDGPAAASIAAARRLPGAPRRLGRARRAAGALLARRGRVDGAQRHLEEVLALYRAAGDGGRVANTFNNLGAVAEVRGDAAAERWYREALDAAGGAPGRRPPASVAAQCAACHQATGAGIPGAFPPLIGHAPAVCAADGGRAYLATLVLYGLQGPIEVDGAAYNGMMTPHPSSSCGRRVRRRRSTPPRLTEVMAGRRLQRRAYGP
ncbi:MAG: tetratricopeptide repeat protein [Trueperaceae bacterium]|nr:tetratricopeptide repeat protein [Trueperaceae bacterium]